MIFILLIFKQKYLIKAVINGIYAQPMFENLMRYEAN